MAVFGIVSIIISVSSNRFIWRPPSSVATVAHRIPSETAILLAVVLCIEDCWPRMEPRRSGAKKKRSSLTPLPTGCMSPDRSTRKTALTDPGGDSRLGVVVTQFVQPLAKLVGLPDFHINHCIL